MCLKPLEQIPVSLFTESFSVPHVGSGLNSSLFLVSRDAVKARIPFGRGALFRSVSYIVESPVYIVNMRYMYLNRQGCVLRARDVPTRRTY